MSRRTETAYKAKSPGKAAQDVKAQDSGDMVNAAVVSRKITALIRGDLSTSVHISESALFGNTQGEWTEVSRGHSRRRESKSLIRAAYPHRRAEHRTGKEPR
jgi:hypothetical protein